MIRAVRAASSIALLLCGTSVAAYDWLQFNGDASHAGNNVQERALDRTNVAQLQFKYQIALPAYGDGAPVFLESVATPSGTRDVLFVTTRAGHLIALDAKTGAQLWSRQSGPGACTVNNGASPCYTRR